MAPEILNPDLASEPEQRSAKGWLNRLTGSLFG
jgi:hypothetical protein